MFRETVDFLAAGIASALNLLNSELVLLGGDGLCWTDRHVADLESAIARLRPADGGGRVLVRKPRFLGEGVLLGGGLRRIARIFSGSYLFKTGDFPGRLAAISEIPQKVHFSPIKTSAKRLTLNAGNGLIIDANDCKTTSDKEDHWWTFTALARC